MPADIEDLDQSVLCHALLLVVPPKSPAYWAFLRDGALNSAAPRGGLGPGGVWRTHISSTGLVLVNRRVEIWQGVGLLREYLRSQHIWSPHPNAENLIRVPHAEAEGLARTAVSEGMGRIVRTGANGREL